MAYRIVLQVVDGQDVLMAANRLLDERLKRRFSKEQMEMALLAAEDELLGAVKEEKKVGVGGTD